MENLKDSCQARTKAGDRCKRNKLKGGEFCHQHEAILKKFLWNQPGGKLDYLPDPPGILAATGAGYWKQYCQFLLDNEKLYGVFLGDMSELCWRIDFRDELLHTISIYGLVNEYKSAVQLIGVDKILDRNDKRITDLKRQFYLTLDTIDKLQKEKKPSTAKKDNITLISKAKTF